MRLTVLTAVLFLGVVSAQTETEPFSPEIYDSITDSLEQSRSEQQWDSVGRPNDSTAARSGAVPADTLHPDTLLAQEQEPQEEPEPRPKRIYRTVALGPAGFINLESSNLAYSAHYGGVLEVNPFVNGRLIGEITTDFTDGFVAGLELGVDIFTSQGVLAPYFGAGFGGGFARGAGENAFGFGISANAGVYLFKNAVFQVNLQGRLYGLLSQINTDYPLYYTLRAGILF